MSIQEIRSELEILSAEERRRLSAFLVALRHRDLVGYRVRMAQRIDEAKPENWITLEELDQRLGP